MHIPLLIHGTPGQIVTLKLKLPDGWQQSFHFYDHFDQYPISESGQYPVTINIQTGNDATKDFQKVSVTAIASGQDTGSVTIQAHLTKDSGLPQ